MIYGYIRVSTGLQTVENQRFEIEQWCLKTNHQKIEEWVEETKSGTIKVEKRKLGELVQKLQKGDTLIISEISRIGRSSYMILATLEELLEKEVGVISIKENYILTNSIASKVMAFAFGISAEIERTLISQRTKEALAYKKSLGIKIGHYKGYKCKNVKLTPYTKDILHDLENGKSIYYIQNKYNVTWTTANNFIQERLHYDKSKIPSVIKFRKNVK